MATMEVATVPRLSKHRILQAKSESQPNSAMEMQQVSSSSAGVTMHKALDAQILSCSASSSIFCRICHEGASQEKLISLCKCRGTVGLLHLSCVERWLSATNTNCCEICGLQFITERRNQHFKQWLRNPTKTSDKRNLIADVMCFVLLTPLAAISAWLCISGAIYYSKASIVPGWETNGLLILSFLLIAIYAVWCLVAVRYHMRVFRDWQKVNQVVRVIAPSPLDNWLTTFGETSLLALLSKFARSHSVDGTEPRVVISSPFLSATDDKRVGLRLSEIRPLYSVSTTDGKWNFGRLPATSLSDTVICSCSVADKARKDFKI